VELQEQDLRCLVGYSALDSDICERFVELRARDFSSRANSFRDMVPQCDGDVECLSRLQEMRLCPRCKLVIQRSEGCNSFYCICGEHFNYALAERAIGDGVKHFRWVLALAKSQRLTVASAAAFGGDIRLFKKASATAAQLGLSCEQALVLHRRAQAGHCGARALIRKSRGTFTRPVEETRVANDGVAYTRADFMRHYGKFNGRWHWDACAASAVLPLTVVRQHDSGSFVVALAFDGRECASVPLEKVMELDVKLALPSVAARGVVAACLFGPRPTAKRESISGRYPQKRHAEKIPRSKIHVCVGRRKC